MTREELLQMREYKVAQASTEYWKKNMDNDEVSIMTAFEDGVVWADEHPKNPWISVEDRLPERMTSIDSNGTTIIDCCSKYVFGYDAMYNMGRLVCYNHESEIWESHDTYTIGRITHWMQIPNITI